MSDDSTLVFLREHVSDLKAQLAEAREEMNAQLRAQVDVELERDAVEAKHLASKRALGDVLEELRHYKKRFEEVNSGRIEDQEARDLFRAERDTARTALAEAEKERDLESLSRDYFRKQHLATAELLASMTAERDALRGNPLMECLKDLADGVDIRTLCERLSEVQGYLRHGVDERFAAERERERAKVEAEVVAYLRSTAVKWVREADVANNRAADTEAEALREAAVRIERLKHRPPAEPKPGDGEGK